jgi:alcohol dehydrogenase (cytochrome c)
LLLFLLTGGPSVLALDWAHVGEERLLKADGEPENWLMVNRTYDSKRYSPLSQIDTRNIKGLVPKWTFPLWIQAGQESTPVVNNGIMIVTGAWSKLYVLDARTGRLLWMREAKLPGDLPAVLCCDAVNRGVAVFGDAIYWVTLNAHLLALEARTGRVIWDVTVEDYKAGYTLTAAPLIVKGKVVIGIAGGEFGIRGFLQAFDAHTGRSLWKTYTVPAPGEVGSETWPGDSDAWKHGGGATWVTGSYDAELNVIYWGTGNPGPNFNGDVRPGNNLYTAAVLALDADTGKIKWFYQWTPHDVWDYDGVNEMVLVDNVKRPNGTMIKKGLIHADKNGHFYLLDRTNGRFIYARPFVYVDSIKVDPTTGNVTALKWPKEGQRVLACPHGTAGKNWQPMSYNPETGLAYVPAVEMCGRFSSRRVNFKKGRYYGGGGHKILSPAWGHLTAIEVSSGRTVWEREVKFPMFVGTVTTAGGLVFAGDSEGTLMALDARTGELLWQFRTSAEIVSAPMTFAVDGKQYVAVVSGMGVRKSTNLAGVALRRDALKMKEVPGSPMLYVFGLPE